MKIRKLICSAKLESLTRGLNNFYYFYQSRALAERQLVKNALAGQIQIKIY